MGCRKKRKDGTEGVGITRDGEVFGEGYKTAQRGR